MRHRIYGKHLGRDKDERDNLFRGLVQALFTCGSIQTSETKAKAIKPLIDKIINSAKNKDVKGQLQSFVTDKNLKQRLTSEIIPKLGTRTSGYTTVVRMGTRPGDQTTMVKLSLIGAEQLSVPGSQLSDKGKPVVSKSVTEKQKTGKLKPETRQQKTDNKKVKKVTSRSK